VLGDAQEAPVLDHASLGDLVAARPHAHLRTMIFQTAWRRTTSSSVSFVVRSTSFASASSRSASVMRGTL
jgi:hypothetical protein